MKFNIAYAPDDNYINQTIVSMVSAIENNKEHEIEFIIIYSKLSEKSLEKLKLTLDLYAGQNNKLRLLKIDEKVFASLPISNWVTVQAWFRIKLPDMCTDLERILYLDCDTLVLNDLSELFETNIDGKYLAGVKDVWGVDKYCKRLGIVSGVYVNSGVLLLNTEYCRQEHFFDKIKEYAAKNTKVIKFCDQDSINKVADEKKIVLHPKYNFMDTWWKGGYYEYKGQEEEDYIEAKENPVIVHLTGIKPAFRGCGNKFKDKWWDYAKLTTVYSELSEDYEKSKEPREPIKDKIFSIKNKYEYKTKIKILTVFGIKIIIQKKPL